MTCREVLTENRTYYVRSDGNDSNDGLANSSSGAFLTVAKSIRTIATLDQRGHDVIIRLDGPSYPFTITENITVDGTKYLFTGRIKIWGNGPASSDCVVAPSSGSPLYVFGEVSVELGYCKIAPPPGHHGVVSLFGARVTVPNLLVAGPTSPAGTQAFYATRGGYIEITGGAVLTGNYFAIFASHHRGEIRIDGGTVTCAHGNAVTYTAYTLGCSEIIVTGGGTVTTSGGSVTGQRYYANGGWIQWAGGSATSLPGSAAGGTANGGIYHT